MSAAAIAQLAGILVGCAAAAFGLMDWLDRRQAARFDRRGRK